MKKLLLAMLSVLSLGLTSCLNNDDEPQKYQGLAFVTNVKAPKTGEVGQEIVFNVTFQLNSNCAHFLKFNAPIVLRDPAKESEYAGIMEVAPIVESEDPKCSNAEGASATKEFKVIPKVPGVYQFKFYSGVKGEGADAKPKFIEVKVTVSNPEKKEKEGGEKPAA
ncbi:MAG: hypothetical protein FQY80_05715 [Ornithobacterium rhinotracheale]|nr:hypothetical protein [Ornithobacterium rhinotracheale]